LTLPNRLSGIPQRLGDVLRVKSGRSRQISSVVIPSATIDTTVATGIRSPGR
jgi:hypothetical protein